MITRASEKFYLIGNVNDIENAHFRMLPDKYDNLSVRLSLD